MTSPPRGPAPARIGRFELLRELGRGAQGAVHLATDTKLGRQVALKTLLLSGEDAAAELEMLLAEARIVSRLQHPNIVTLFDAGEERGAPYLVFEYVEGSSLQQRIRTGGRLPVAEAVRIALALLDGIGYAHARQVMHRDLKPANIMLTPDGVPRLMDFGIAIHGSTDEEAEFCGTPTYMAPEYISTHKYQASCDLFSLGVVLYEMLTASPPVRSRDPYQTMHRIVYEAYEPPSRANTDIAPELDLIVMKALAKDPAERYENAAAMAAALSGWLAPEPEAPDAAEPARQGTLEFLLRRMRRKSDFPALSGALSAVTRVAADREHASVLCNSILKDFSITNKLLRIVNAVSFAQFGGTISTVSRAVAILGFDQVRSIALSLVLFEHLHDKPQAAELKDDVVSSYFAAILARELGDLVGVRDPEQAFICAMYHRLGKLLTSFYLREEAQEITRLMQTRGFDEGRASRTVLGISYEELAVGVGKAWNLPETILGSMRSAEGKIAARPVLEDDKLRVVSDLSNSLAQVVRTSNDRDREARLAGIVERFGAATGVSAKRLTGAVQESLERLTRDADVLGYSATTCPVVANAKSWGVAAAAPRGEDATIDGIVSDTILHTADPAQFAASPGEAGPKANRQAALAAGVQDITNTLVGDYQLNDVLRIILETMYRAMGFTRVLLFVADPARQALRCRFGFGTDVDAFVQQGLSLPTSGPRDIFFAAVGQGADLCLDNLDSPKVSAYVPAWYRKAIGAKGMVLLPVIINKKTVGLIYADADRAETLSFRPEELSLLKTLRNQAVLAIRQKT
ncbi:MAG: protein kinase [Proteobacteria bacterium]|nr:protein kinase [Pseudomonadota bacterium]